MRRAVAAAVLGLTMMMAAEPAAAYGRRHRVVVRHRVWVGRHVVVHSPVVVAPMVVNGRPHGAIDLKVEPADTMVYVDGELRGHVDDFDGVPGKLLLLPGVHRLKLEAPGGDAWSEKVRVVAGHEINISLEMEPK